MTSDRFAKKTVAAMIFALLLFGVVFTVFPGLDLWISGLFYDPQQGFWIGASRPVQVLRKFVWRFNDSLALIALLVLVGNVIFRPARTVSNRWLSFLVTSYVLGPGLLVNVLLKENWGRARPIQVSEFGGALEFTPALEISDQCAANCSFVSGEASAAVTMMLVLGLVLVPRLPRGSGLFAIGLLSVVAIGSGGLRVAFGAHFLSDVLFGAVLVSLLTCLLFMALKPGDHPFLVTRKSRKARKADIGQPEI